MGASTADCIWQRVESIPGVAESRQDDYENQLLVRSDWSVLTVPRPPCAGTRRFSPMRLRSHRVEDSCVFARAGSFSAQMLSSVLVARETIVLSQLSLRGLSFWLLPSWGSLATVESQQPVEWSVVARRSLP